MQGTGKPSNGSRPNPDTSRHEYTVRRVAEPSETTSTVLRRALKEGDKVRINAPHSEWHGMGGVVGFIPSSYKDPYVVIVGRATIIAKLSQLEALW